MFLDRYSHLFTRWKCEHMCLHFLSIHFQPSRYCLALIVIDKSFKLIMIGRLVPKGQHIPLVDQNRWGSHLSSVDLKMAVHDQLPGMIAGMGKSDQKDDVVQPTLQHEQQSFSCNSLFSLGALEEELKVVEPKLKEELARRRKVIEWMLERKIFDYKEVARVISTYYSSPGRLMNMIMHKSMD